MKQVRQIIEEQGLLQPGDYVLVGVSGGPDSVALLHLLWTDHQEGKYQLHVVHLNHQLRGAAADEETAYVQQLAARLGLPCSVFYRPVADYAREQGMSLEQAGHVLRFACFRQVAEETGANKLALGHHQGDQAETVLLHLIRGCGLDGLAAMPAADGWIIRPLLAVNKEQLLQYCAEQKLDYYLDASNGEPDCLRNKIRLELLPLLEKQYNQQMTNNLLRLAELCHDDRMELEQRTAQLWEQHGQVGAGKVSFPLAVLLAQSRAMQRRLLRYAYQQLKGSTEGLSYRQLEAMGKCTQLAKGEKRLHLTGGIVFIKGYDHFSLLLGQEAFVAAGQSYCYHWHLLETFILPEKQYVFSMERDTKYRAASSGYWQIAVDGACLPAQLTIRTRQPGDWLRLPGLTGRKKLKEFFIDRKIPVSERQLLPLIVHGTEIIWIPGYFLAESVRITDRTTEYYILQCTPK